MKHSPLMTPVACLASLILLAAGQSRAAGPIGVDGGWVINNTGGILLTPAVCAGYTANGVGWLRVNMRLVNGNTAWNSTMLGYYDAAINNARAAGLQCVILMGGEAWNGGQSSWNANNHENNSSANGDNSYIDSYATGAVNPIVAHFHDRVKVYEIWNEPSTWTSQSGSVISGATFVYPSCYSWMLTKSWEQVHKTLGYSDCTVISGGIFGTTQLPSNDPNYINENSGAGWLTRVFQQGNNSTVNSFLSAHNAYGVYPVDGYGEHLYIDYNITTSAADCTAYFGKVRNAYTAYDNTGKGTWMTEFGWNTTYVSQSVQAANLTTAFNDFNIGASGAYIKYGSWFTWQDGGAGNFGLIDSGGTHKASYGNFGNEAHYEGRTAINNGGQNSYILNYYNNWGRQAVFGNPYDNGGSAYVHKWTGGTHWGNVQDFTGGTKINTILCQSGLSGNPTFEINNVHGFRDYYLANGGMGFFGCPIDNENPDINGLDTQHFETHYLTWTSSGGTVLH